jgi:hypothetical protein
MQDGVAFYFQYLVPNQGKEVKRSFPLGEYDETGRRAYRSPALAIVPRNLLDSTAMA